LKNRRFYRIVYNFPHAGFKGKEDDMHMIKYVSISLLCSLAVTIWLNLV
jgi:hypothetical protein